MLPLSACHAHLPPPVPSRRNGYAHVLLREAERLAAQLGEEPAAVPPAVLQPGDIVQLRPDADPTWGGLLARIIQATGWRLRGYLLLPHRGGGRDAWVSLKPCEVVRVGALLFPEAEWGFRHQSARVA